MSNPFEKPTGSKKEENTSQKDNFGAIKSAIESKTGKKLPEDKEQLFRNFDDLIPKEIDHINFKEGGWHVGVKKNPDGSDDFSQAAGFAFPRKISREEIKATLEKGLYGTTMRDINEFFEKELEESDEALSQEQGSIDRGYKKTFDDKIFKKHDKASELFNQLNFGSLEVPLANIELRIHKSHSINNPENDLLRKFAERLSAEVYKDKPKNEVSLDDIRKTFVKNGQYFTSDVIDKDNKEYNKEHFRKVFEDFDQGSFDSTLKEIDFSIGWIQEILEDRKNKDLKNVLEEGLKERFGESFMPVVIKELEKLRSYRKFLMLSEYKKEGKNRNENRKEQIWTENKQNKEKLEGEKLFQYQIENNSHTSAKNLKEELALFIKGIDGGYMRTGFQGKKEELSEILYRNDIEYEENKEIKINENDKEIIQPILDFRKELDNWNTVTETRIADFRKRLIGYLKDTFGIDVQEPREGEKYDSKEMQAIKVEETKNEFLDYKIKKVYSSGFKINEKLFDYYKKWLGEKEQEMRKKWQFIKSTLSEQAFDKMLDEDKAWLTQHQFGKSIKPAQVDIYRYKA